MKLIIPQEDNDDLETNLQQDVRKGFDICSKDDKLDGLKLFIAWDYYKAGWNDAIKKYSIKE